MTKLRTVIQIGADGKQAARVFAGLKDDANELDDASERAGLSFSRAADAMGDMPGPLGAAAGFMTGPAGLVAGAGALGAAVFKAADAAAEAAVEVGTLAELTSTSTEEASKLASVFGKAGVEGKDLSDIMLQTAGVLADDADLAEQLGVNLSDGGNIRDSLSTGGRCVAVNRRTRTRCSRCETVWGRRRPADVYRY